MTEISERVKVRSGTTAASADDEETHFDAFFPHFVWAIRDFILELELDGSNCTPDGYLEHALTPRKGENKISTRTLHWHEHKKFEALLGLFDVGYESNVGFCLFLEPALIGCLRASDENQLKECAFKYKF